MKRFIRTLFLLMVIAGLPLVGLEVYLRIPIEHPDLILTVNPGQSLNGTARQLERAGVIHVYPFFIAYARLQGSDRSIKAGEYAFPSGMTPREVFSKLQRGQFRTFRVQILEGWTLRQVADAMAKASFVTDPQFAEAFLEACRAPERLARLKALGFDAPSLEGFLFPDTYFVHRPRSAGALVDRFLEEFARQWNGDLLSRARHYGLSPVDVVTLASIIEKETGSANERRLVSAVFHNRLKKGMGLESDPTVIYGIKDFDGNIRRADLSNPHPYNTYVHKGLPPGPIANPGKASLEAAVSPADVDYLFFVSQNNGTHVFSNTYREHVNAVNQYQRGR